MNKHQEISNMQSLDRLIKEGEDKLILLKVSKNRIKNIEDYIRWKHRVYDLIPSQPYREIIGDKAALDLLNEYLSTDNGLGVDDYSRDKRNLICECELLLGKLIKANCGMSVTPQTKKYFVAHYYGRKDANNFRQTIKRAFSKYGMKPVYADNVYNGPEDILKSKIIDLMEKSDFVICDISELRDNVVLELGVALGLRKLKFILIKKGKEKDVRNKVSDLHGIEYLSYDPNNYQQLEKDLQCKFKQL